MFTSPLSQSCATPYDKRLWCRGSSPTYNNLVGRAAGTRPCPEALCMASWIDVLQSSGPISLNELNMRSSETPEELVRQVENLRRKGIVIVTGPKKDNLSSLSSEEVAQSSDTMVELSWSGLKRSLS